jgi:hypothetical protein
VPRPGLQLVRPGRHPRPRVCERLPPGKNCSKQGVREGSCVARQRVKDEPWYQQWREALDRVIRAQMARDKARRGKQRTKGFRLQICAGVPESSRRERMSGRGFGILWQGRPHPADVLTALAHGPGGTATPPGPLDEKPQVLLTSQRKAPALGSNSATHPPGEGRFFLSSKFYPIEEGARRRASG